MLLDIPRTCSEFDFFTSERTVLAPATSLIELSVLVNQVLDCGPEPFPSCTRHCWNVVMRNELMFIVTRAEIVVRVRRSNLVKCNFIYLTEELMCEVLVFTFLKYSNR